MLGAASVKVVNKEKFSTWRGLNYCIGVVVFGTYSERDL